MNAAWISPAFNGYPVIYRQIDWSGSPGKFTVHLVELLNRYGQIYQDMKAVYNIVQSLVMDNCRML